MNLLDTLMPEGMAINDRKVEADECTKRQEISSNFPRDG